MLEWWFRGEAATVLSYPKSGRTWLRYMLDLAGAKLAFSHGGHGTARVAEIGNPFVGPVLRGVARKIVFLHRNPIDTAVSMFFQVHKRNFVHTHPDYFRMKSKFEAADNMPPGEIDAFVMHPIWGVENISKYNRGWIDHLGTEERPNLIVSYEAMRANPEDELRAIFDFLGLRNADHRSIVKRSEFGVMQKIELEADHELRRKTKLYGMKGDDPNTLKVRKGRIGGYVDELSPATVRKCRETAAAYGFEA